MANLTDDRAAIDALSKAVLQTQFASSVSFVVTGLPCCVANLLLCTTIVKTKSLRSNFYLCLMHAAIAEMLYCLFYSFIGLKRIILVAFDMAETTTPFSCVGILFPGASVRNVSVAQTVTISFDRLICVAAPVRYLKLKTAHLQMCNLLMWILPLSIMIASCCVYLMQSEIMHNCTLGLTWAPQYAEIFSGMGLWLIGMSICQYVAIVPLLLMRIKIGINSGHSMAEIKKSLQFNAVITSFLLLAVYICFFLSSEIFVLATNTLDAATKAKIQPYGTTFQISSSGLSFIVCVARNHDIRKAICNSFRPKTRIVQVSTSSHMASQRNWIR